MNIVAVDFSGRHSTDRQAVPVSNATHDECQALLQLGDSLAARMPQSESVLRSWREAVGALSHADLEPHAFEAELDRLALALRRICLGLAHASSDRALRSPRDRDLTTMPDGQEL